MTFEFKIILQYIIPFGIIAIAVFIGLLFKKYIHSRLKQVAEKTSWRGDDLLISVIGKSIYLWFLLGGIYLGINNAPFPEKIVNGIETFIIVVIILSVAHALAKVSIGMLQLYAESTNGAFPSTTMITNLAKIFIMTIGFLVVFQTLGISITPVLTALGIGGLAISLALKDTLSDLFSGLHILLSKKMKPGDLIALENGERGTVENISWRDTTIRDRFNNLIVVPNSKLSTSMITNFDVPVKSMVTRIECGVSYDSDLEHVERVVLDVAKDVLNTVEGGLLDSEPSMMFHTFGESSIDFRVSLMAMDYIGSYRIKHEFIKRIHKRFNEEGISIPFPIRTIYQVNE